MHSIQAPAPFTVTSLTAHLRVTWPEASVTDPGDGRGLLLVDAPAERGELAACLATYAHDPASEAVAAATAEAMAERARRLADSATWAMPDTPEGPERDGWLAYRTQLHGLPGQPGWPSSFVWPSAPQPFLI